MAPPEYTLTVQKLGSDEFLARAYSTTGATTVRHRKYPTWNDLESAIAPIVGAERMQQLRPTIENASHGVEVLQHPGLLSESIIEKLGFD